MKTKRRFNKKNNLTKKITNYYSIPSDVSFAAEAVSNNPTSTNMKRFVSKITTNIKRNQKSCLQDKRNGQHYHQHYLQNLNKVQLLHKSLRNI